MRVLITWGTTMGGTEGIARILGDALRDPSTEVDLVPARQVRSLAGYDAAIVGGALYANRWHPDARRFVRQHRQSLRRIPTWFFSSGPLDDSAARTTIAPTQQVKTLMESVGALGHATFGGRLAPDAKSFMARGMAKEHAGDWRDGEHIGGWARQLRAALPASSPGLAIDHPGRAWSRVLVHGILGWAACAAIMAGLLAVAGTTVALVLHAILAPIVFVLVSRHYFAPPGAREPGWVALAFTAIVALLDLGIVAGLFQRSLAMFGSIAGTWLPFALIFGATYLTGFIMSTLPWPKADKLRSATKH